jgi:phosphatidylserine decarboxylase
MTLEKFTCQLQSLLPHHCLSRLVANLAESTNPHIKNRLINLFIKHYKIDLSIAQSSDLNHYGSFNDFFVRALKPESRPICDASDAFISPADGFVSQFGRIDNGQLIQAKGSLFSLQALLGNDERATEYLNGDFVTIYLSPKDYHRVHMPLAGKLTKTVYIPGKLFSVNFATSKHVPNLFCRNERLVCFFDTQIGEIAIILVGAMLVAGIETVWGGQVAPNVSKKIIVQDYSQDNIELQKGAEMGRFKFGSTVILLMGPGKLQLCPFSDQQPIKMGELLGKIIEQKAQKHGNS